MIYFNKIIFLDKCNFLILFFSIKGTIIINLSKPLFKKKHVRFITVPYKRHLIPNAKISFIEKAQLKITNF